MRILVGLLALCAWFAVTAVVSAQHPATHESDKPAMEHPGHAGMSEKSGEEHRSETSGMGTEAMGGHSKSVMEAPSESGSSEHAGHAMEMETRPMKEHAKAGAEAPPASEHGKHAEPMEMTEGSAAGDHPAPQGQGSDRSSMADHASQGSEASTEMDHSGHSEEAAGGLRQIMLSPYARKLAEVEVAPVQRKDVQVEIRMVGMIDYDETRLGYITAWVPGRLDRLYVDFTGTTVKEGDPMVSLFSPELLTAQAELLQALKAVQEVRKTRVESILKTATQTVEAAREKLRLWGFTKAQVDAVIQRGSPSDHMTVLAPMGGVVIHKNAFEGMYVQTGSRIYTIADLGSVWVKLDAYESDLEWSDWDNPWISSPNRFRAGGSRAKSRSWIPC